MATKRKHRSRWFVASVALILLRLTAALPLPVCSWIGRRLGALAYYLVPRVRRDGMANLDRAYGDSLSTAEKRDILKRASRNMGTIATEFSHIPALAGKDNSAMFRVEGYENVDTTRGALGISAHLGNWEWMATAFQPLNVRPIGIVRPLDDPRLQEIVDSIRSAGGFDPVSKDDAGMGVVKAIKEGRFVAILVDQSPRENGVPTTFFGEPCWSTVAPAMVALRAKAPVHAMATVREPDGTFTLRIGPELEFDLTGSMRERLVSISQTCQDAIEELVRAYPDQWLWMHRRWKDRPRLEAEWAKKAERDKPSG